MTVAPGKIRTPLKQQWRQFRYRFLPVVVFSATVAATAWLWQQHAGPSGFPGRAEAKSANITASVSAAILPLPGIEPLDRDSVVEKNQVIVMFDTTRLDKEIEVAVAELARQNKQIESTRQDFEIARKERAEAIRAEEARLYQERRDQRGRIVEHETQIKVAEADKLRVDQEAEDLAKLEAFELRELRRRGITIEFKQLEAKALQVQIEEGHRAIKFLEKQIEEVETALKPLAEIDPPQVARTQLETALSPFVKAVDVQTKRIEQLDERKESYIIKAPISGKITSVLKWPGQTVEPGELIYVISAEVPEYITAYVRQGPHYRPQVGDVVDVRLRTRPPRVSHGKVVQVGAKFEPVPPEHLRNPNVPEWGYPVRIEIPQDFVGELDHGEKVDLTFSASASGGGLMVTARETLQRSLGRASVIGAAQAVR